MDHAGRAEGLSAADAYAAAASQAGAGNFAAALDLALKAVRRDSRHGGAWQLIACLQLQEGRLDHALAAATNALRIAPDDARPHFILGRICKAGGDLPRACEHYRISLQLDPAQADAWNSLGIALRASGQGEEAILAYREALRRNPAHTEARNNLGNALLAAGRSQEAAPLLEAARAVLSAELQRLQRTSDAKLSEGRPDEALDAVRQALRLAPDHVSLHLRAGRLLHAGGNVNFELALQHTATAARLDPSSVEAADASGRMAISLGLGTEAKAWLGRAQALEPTDGRRVQMKLALAAVESSAESIAATRRGYEAALDELLDTPLAIPDPISAVGIIPFFLAYHGEGNRTLQEKLARVLLRACPGLDWVAPHCRAPAVPQARLRIGLLSAHLHSHSIGKTSRGLVERFSRELHEVFVLRVGSVRDDAVARRIDAHADHILVLDGPLERMREQIAALKLDVLFYQDIGMEPISYFLAFSRLAPVQCVSFGHPDTTGIPNVDYFVSNDRFEVDGAAEHYSERLFLLHDLPTLAYYFRPQRSRSARSRADLGLDPSRRLYLCPQTLFKLHPDFDEIALGILERDPLGELLLIRGRYDIWKRALEARFQRRIPSVAGRIRFLPEVPQPVFFDLLAAADVVLDTPHFNGMNSSLEAFAVGAPVVTLPTGLQRGRHTQAMYRSMEIEEPVARDPAHYVETAVRIATDRDLSTDLRRRILERNHALYEQDRVVTEFERFFAEARARVAP